MRTALLVVVLIMALSAFAGNINEQCLIHDGSKITCSCIGNEEFFLPDDYNYTNITSVKIQNCMSVNLHYSSLPEATRLDELIISNISGKLDFSVYITSSRMRKLHLLYVGWIPKIANHTFVTLTAIDSFIIHDAHIGYIEEEFSFVNVSDFSMMKVIIERVNLLNFSENGTTVATIKQSELRSIATSLNFANFGFIEVINSKFALQKPGLVSLQSGTISVKDSVFWNASLNLVAEFIMVRGICADGKSTLRLSAKYIDSGENRLPNEIAYPTKFLNLMPELPLWQEHSKNTVCKAGNCKCSENSGKDACRSCVSVLALGCLLVALLSREVSDN